MKNLYILLFLFSILTRAQGIKKLNIKDYVIKASFLKNKFSPHYLLIADFKTVKVDSKIKLAKVLANTGWGYINEKGDEVVPAVFNNITGFRNGVAIVDYMMNSTVKGNCIEQKGVINYKGQLIASIENNYNKISDTEHFTKDFFYSSENYLTGILTPDGRTLIPLKYQNIIYTDHYFFADQPGAGSDFKKTVDIYSKKGNFLKTIKNTLGVYEYNSHLVQTDEKGEYFIDNKNFQRIDNRNFSRINHSETSSLFKLEVSYDNPNDVFETYYLDDRLQIVSPSFPNATAYKDRFLIQPVFNKNEEIPHKYIIANFNNKKIAEYSYDDFMIYQYFAHGKLDTPKYLESQKTFWSKLTKDNLSRSQRWDYYKLENRNQFTRFFEDDAASGGIIDAEKGKVMIKKSKEKVSEIYYIPENHIFIEKLNKKNEWTLNILDSNGNFLKKVEGMEISEISKEFLMVKRKSDTLEYRTIHKYNLLNTKTFEPIFEEDTKDFSNLNYRKGQNYLFFQTSSEKTGIINNKYKIIRAPQPISGDFSSDENVMIIKKDRNLAEIVDKKTLKTILDIEFKDGILKKEGDKDKNGNIYPTYFSTGYYRNGFYLLNEEKNIMDRYGNIVDTPLYFNLFQE